MIVASDLTRDSSRLEALCGLWKATEAEFWVCVTGRSMAPTIPDGSRIRLSCLQRSVNVGEIVAYQRGHGLVAHRVVALLPDYISGQPHLLCRGDGNAHLDAPVPADWVVGVVTAIRRPSVAQCWSRLLRYIARQFVAVCERLYTFTSSSKQNHGRGK